ncbi:MAG: hypothetical protein LBM38_06515 [Clostridiales bacterium]|jgi:transcriptional regulator with XRE-family HTH domain|nr:hypothetical protein [Clostridiales bacterium]
MAKYEELNIANKLKAIAGWAKNGASKADIAQKLGVSVRQVTMWEKSHDDFAMALRNNSEVADGELLATAFDCATGYYVEEEDAIKVKSYEEVAGKAMAVEKVKKVKVKKYIPPNNTMAMFMLKSRFSEYGEDKSAKVDKVIIKSEFDDELEELSK